MDMSDTLFLSSLSLISTQRWSACPNVALQTIHPDFPRPPVGNTFWTAIQTHMPLTSQSLELVVKSSRWTPRLSFEAYGVYIMYEERVTV